MLVIQYNNNGAGSWTTTRETSKIKQKKNTQRYNKQKEKVLLYIVDNLYLQIYIGL